MEKFANTD